MTQKHRNPRPVPRDWNNTTMQWEYVCPDCKTMVASITHEAVTAQWGTYPEGKPQPWATHNCPNPKPNQPLTGTIPNNPENTKENNKK